MPVMKTQPEIELSPCMACPPEIAQAAQDAEILAVDIPELPQHGHSREENAPSSVGCDQELSPNENETMFFDCEDYVSDDKVAARWPLLSLRLLQRQHTILKKSARMSWMLSRMKELQANSYVTSSAMHQSQNSRELIQRRDDGGMAGHCISLP